MKKGSEVRGVTPQFARVNGIWRSKSNTEVESICQTPIGAKAAMSDSGGADERLPSMDLQDLTATVMPCETRPEKK